MNETVNHEPESSVSLLRRIRVDFIFARLGIHRLSDQITAVFAAALALTVGILSTLWADRYVDLTLDERHSAAAAVTQSVGALVADAVITRDLTIVDRVVADAARFPGILGVDVVGVDGRLLGTAGREGAGAAAIGRTDALRPPTLMDGDETDSGDQGDTAERWLKIKTGAAPAWVRVRYDLSVVAKARREIWVNAAFTALASIVGTVLLLRLLLIRPMGLISETARFASRLARRKGATLDADVGAREVSALRQSLNEASLSLARQDEELRTANEQLERRVAERTAELSKTIHSLKEAQQQLIQAEKMASLGTLAGGVAHEINTPAQFLSSNLQFLETAFADLGRVLAAVEANAADFKITDPTAVLSDIDAEFLKAEIPLAIAQSKEGLARISEIVNAIKTYARPQNAESEPIDLPAAIHAAVTITRNQWKHVAEMELDLAPGAALVIGQPGGINQVLVNLIVNAAHAIEEKDGGLGKIRIVTRRHDHETELRVEDSGAGIRPENLSRIFDPFFTTKPVGKGTGQGLAICHAIISTGHGGTIAASSPPGKGAIFTIRLPNQPPTANGAATP